MPQASSFVFSWGVGPALLSSTSVAWALGMGNISNNTVLGSPLNVTVPVLGSADEKVPPPAECIKAEVEAGETVLPPRQIKTSLEPGRGEALYRVQVVSDVRINEPVVTVTLSLGCGSPLTKRFVLFVDPPGMPLGAPAAPAVQEGGAASASVRPTPRVLSSALPSLPSATSSDQGRPAARGTKTGTVSSAPGRSSASTGRSRAVPQKTPLPGKSGPRLSLEAPTVTAVPPPAAAASASDPAAEDPALANQMALLTQLEEMLKQVSTENKAVQSGMATLQAKLQAAEAELKREREKQREQPLIVWVLSGVIAVMAVVLMALIWRQRRRTQKPFYSRDSVMGDGPPDETAQIPVLDSMPSQLEVAEPVLVAQRASPLVVPPAEVPPAPAEVRAVVDEVVDLEQQADFFIALGQDQAAIDLLNSHTNSTQGNSPVPYLKLIEIHRRRGDRMAYEQLRLRFHRRFNARIPEWGAPPAVAHGLDDYPEIQQSLETHWSDPAAALKLLEAHLFRREGQGTTFDLSAYRDLLMLHAVARDLFAQANAPVVDLELPILNES